MELCKRFLLDLVRGRASKVLVSKRTYSLIRSWCRDELEFDHKIYITDPEEVWDGRHTRVPIQCTTGMPYGLVSSLLEDKETAHRWFPNVGDDSIHEGNHETCDACCVVIVMSR